MVMLDANMILRYLLNDNKDMADKAEQYIEAGDVFVTVEVVAEVVYVLKGVYSMGRDKIANAIKGFLKIVLCPATDILNLALDTYAKNNLDFVDCVLYAYHRIRGMEIATFDRKLLKLMMGESL